MEKVWMQGGVFIFHPPTCSALAHLRRNSNSPANRLRRHGDIVQLLVAADMGIYRKRVSFRRAVGIEAAHGGIDNVNSE